jgi:hypothetical protein
MRWQLCMFPLSSVALLACSSGGSGDSRSAESADTGPATETLVLKTTSGVRKEYVPATAVVSPGSRCAIHPEGNTSPSETLSVVADDVGVARFLAVRPETANAVGRLALDCLDGQGKSATYSVDLRSEATFASRAASPSSRHHLVPLAGDPLARSQAELLRAGYGLRPDPAKSPQAYARWLAAVTRSGRTPSSGAVGENEPVRDDVSIAGDGVFRPANGPSSPPGHFGYESGTPDFIGLGAVMTGAPDYVQTSVEFTVPTALLSDFEDTDMFIWSGLGGLVPSGNGGVYLSEGNGYMIQAGVNLQTTSTMAYYSVYSACCGIDVAPVLSPYSFPLPGDRMFSETWYCDADGNWNLHGGYACNYIMDATSGDYQSCSYAADDGFNCPSLPIPAVADSAPGTSAELMVTAASGSSLATFTSQLKMEGSAESLSAGTAVTVNTDPSVTVLGGVEGIPGMYVNTGPFDQVNFCNAAYADECGGGDSVVPYVRHDGFDAVVHYCNGGDLCELSFSPGAAHWSRVDMTAYFHLNLPAHGPLSADVRSDGVDSVHFVDTSGNLNELDLTSTGWAPSTFS